MIWSKKKSHATVPLKDGKLQEKPSALKREHPTLKKLNFKLFSIFWLIVALLDPGIRIENPDPDPGTLLNVNPIQIQIRIHNTEYSLSKG